MYHSNIHDSHTKSRGERERTFPHINTKSKEREGKQNLKNRLTWSIEYLFPLKKSFFLFVLCEFPHFTLNFHFHGVFSTFFKSSLPSLSSSQQIKNAPSHFPLCITLPSLSNHSLFLSLQTLLQTPQTQPKNQTF